MKVYIVDILSNLSCENQANKALMVRKNLIQLLGNILVQTDVRDDMIASSLRMFLMLPRYAFFDI